MKTYNQDISGNLPCIYFVILYCKQIVLIMFTYAMPCHSLRCSLATTSENSSWQFSQNSNRISI